MYLYNVNKTRTMNEKEEISALLHRLTQLKMELKMTEFTFKNNKKLTEQQVNSILDEKLRIENPRSGSTTGIVSIKQTITVRW